MRGREGGERYGKDEKGRKSEVRGRVAEREGGGRG
jgi:hypothetical protein